MKRILITGANSYIGTSFETYMRQWPQKYAIETVDMIGGGWRNKSFQNFDVVYHVAGIAHSDISKVSEEEKKQYYRVNAELAIETAQKAKREGVRQFIFMSSGIVYGDSTPIGVHKEITRDTPVAPANFYGDSKAQGEQGILLLNDENFKVVILRPPMIYGRGCKGNYPLLAKIAQKLPVFPYVKNERSMLYIGNLVEFVRLMIENEENGIFWPQNAEYSNTSELVKMIAEAHGKRIILIPGFSWLLKLFEKRFKVIDKAFGNSIYDLDMSNYGTDYQMCSLRESIWEIEGRENSG